MDINQRTKEIVDIFKTLKNLNLGIDSFTEFDEFRVICNNFIKTGQHSKGNIKVHGTKRIISYNFNNKVECMLKYDDTV